MAKGAPSVLRRLVARLLALSARVVRAWAARLSVAAERAQVQLGEEDSVPLLSPWAEGEPGPPAHWLERLRRSEVPLRWIDYRAPERPVYPRRFPDAAFAGADSAPAQEALSPDPNAAPSPTPGRGGKHPLAAPAAQPTARRVSPATPQPGVAARNPSRPRPLRLRPTQQARPPAAPPTAAVPLAEGSESAGAPAAPKGNESPSSIGADVRVREPDAWPAPGTRRGAPAPQTHRAPWRPDVGREAPTPMRAAGAPPVTPSASPTLREVSRDRETPRLWSSAEADGLAASHGRASGDAQEVADEASRPTGRARNPSAAPQPSDVGKAAAGAQPSPWPTLDPSVEGSRPRSTFSGGQGREGTRASLDALSNVPPSMEVQPLHAVRRTAGMAQLLWPSLPDDQSAAPAADEAQLRAWRRRQRLAREQDGDPWNESLF